MRDSPWWLRFSCVVSALVVVAACSAREDPASTAEREPTFEASSPVEPTVQGSDGSLAALTAEVRQLRLAVEEIGRSQTEAQALGAYLSAQQTRIAQAEQRLDVARKELDSANARSRELESGLSNMSAEVASATDQSQRARLEDGIRGLKAEQSHFALDLEQARNREREATAELQVQERRWNELISRVERLAQ